MLNPFSLVLVLIILSCFIFTKSIKHIFFNLLLFTTFIQLFVQVGFFIEIEESDVNYRTICELLLLILSIPLIVRKGKFRLNMGAKYAFMLFAVIAIGLMLTWLFPSDAQVASIEGSWDDILVKGAAFSNPRISGFVIQQTFQLVCAVFVVLACYNNFENKDFLLLLQKFSLLIKFVFCIFFVELLLKYLFQFEGWGEIVKAFFGLSDSTSVIARSRGFGIELTGLTKEASHHAYSLFVSLLILWANRKLSDAKNDFWIILGAVFLFLSMSFSAVLFGIGLGGIFLLYRWNGLKVKQRRREQLVLGLAFLGVLLMLIQGIVYLDSEGFFSRRILSLVEEFTVLSNDTWQQETEALEWSNRVRLLSVFMSIKAFVSRPVFGYGLGSITCHGSTVMMLSGVGLIGIAIWVRFFFSNIRNRFSFINKGYFRMSVILFLAINMLNSLALRPFYEFHTFFIAISFVVFYSKQISLNDDFNYNTSL